MNNFGTMNDIEGRKGLHENNDGTYTALTHSTSKEYKSKPAAIKWLKSRGYNPDGSRV